MALSMNYGLVQEQRMKLVMTPALRQALKVLQFSAPDLMEFIQEQVMENPILEMEDSVSVQGEETAETIVLKESLQDWAVFLRHGSRSRTSPVAWDEGDPVDRIASAPDSLMEVLEAQLRYLSLDIKQREICSYIIGNLDENGYLTVDIPELCKRFNRVEEEIFACLKVVHTLDPAGVGARSLSECLRIQMLREEEPDPIACKIIDSHLSDLAEGRYKQVAKVLHCDVSRIQAALDKIKKLNPRPGLIHSSGGTRYVFPDATVERVDGEFHVTVNDSYIPRLSIRREYENMLQRDDEDARRASAYIRDRLQSAVWLLKSIEQRRQTLYRVTEAILKEQRAFFESGTAYLKPLTLRQIAEALDLHESTVSRATQHKYIQTPRGLFPYRFFFPAGISTRTGNTSARSVKDRIVRLISEESKQKPLSDQKIADRLREEGVRISRRTVAKYREELGIAASKLRRRFK